LNIRTAEVSRSGKPFGTLHQNIRIMTIVWNNCYTVWTRTFQNSI